MSGLLRLVASWAVVVGPCALGQAGCWHPFRVRAAAPSVLARVESELRPAAIGSPAVGVAPARVEYVPRYVSVPYQRTELALSGLRGGELSIPAARPASRWAAVAPVLASPEAPPVLWQLHRWLWAAVIACGVAAVLAAVLTHFLAAIKFGLAAVLGAAGNWLFGVVVGSFVLSFFAGVAIGLILGYYVLNGRFHFEASGVEQNLNARMAQLERFVAGSMPPAAK